MNRRVLFLILTGLAGLAGCHSSPPREVTSEPLAAQVLLQYPQCGTTSRDPEALWIDDPRSVEQRPSGFNTSLTSHFTLQFELDFSQGSALRAALGRVDFPREGVLVITMGQKPSGGYQLDYLSDSARLTGKTLELTAIWQQPEPDTFVTQMIISPCLLLKLPAVVFEKIKVFDPSGKIQIETYR